MNTEERIELLTKLLEENRFKALREEIIELNEVDISEFIGILPKDKAIIVFRFLPKDLAAEVFSNLEIDVQEKIIHEITDQELGYILDEMFMDDMVDMLEELPAGVVKRVLKNTDEKTRQAINTFLKYPKDSAGSIMTAEYTNLRADMSVKEAIRYLRKHGADSETLYNCYVIDRNRVLDGVITLRTLLLSAMKKWFLKSWKTMSSKCILPTTRKMRLTSSTAMITCPFPLWIRRIALWASSPSMTSSTLWKMRPQKTLSLWRRLSPQESPI